MTIEHSLSVYTVYWWQDLDIGPRALHLQPEPEREGEDRGGQGAARHIIEHIRHLVHQESFIEKILSRDIARTNLSMLVHEGEEVGEKEGGHLHFPFFPFLGAAAGLNLCGSEIERRHHFIYLS